MSGKRRRRALPVSRAAGTVGTKAQRKRQVRKTPGRPRWLWPLVGLAGIVIAAAVVIAILNRGQSPAAANAPAGLVQAAGQPVDGIKCESHEQAIFHIHAHLAILVGGQMRQVPAGIGIQDPQSQQTAEGPFLVSGSCFYWLHSHTQDGVIHIEAPEQRTFTLGNYFDVWGQPLGNSVVAGDRGQVIAYVDGQRFTGAPARSHWGPIPSFSWTWAPTRRPSHTTFGAGL